MRRLPLLLPLGWLLLALSGCGPTYPKCNKDKDCHEKEFCVNGQCQQCRDDKDCGAGQTCNKGRCEAAQQACTDDSQCPSGQSCISGVCKPCASDDQCGAGGKCNAGRCTRAPAGGLGGGGAGGGGAGGCTLEPVYFDFNESSLSTEATGAIDRDIDCIKKSGGSARLLLTGRTDPRGTEEYNLALSDRRAQSVKDRLVREGVDNGRIKTVARGELDATGTDESGWAKDRRVDVSW